MTLNKLIISDVIVNREIKDNKPCLSSTRYPVCLILNPGKIVSNYIGFRSFLGRVRRAFQQWRFIQYKSREIKYHLNHLIMYSCIYVDLLIKTLERLE